jgi:hypothetical protein
MFRRRATTWTLAVSGACLAVALSVGLAVASGGGSGGGTTLSPSAAKQQYLDWLQQQRAQDLAGPAAPKNIVPSFAPCSPQPLPTAGLDNNSVQVGPGSYDTFVTSNQWTGPISGSTQQSFVVWAGITGTQASTPGVPAVAVSVRSLSADGCTVTLTRVGTFTVPQATGAASITAVNGPWVSLRTSAGGVSYFNLSSDQFSTTTSA